MIRHLLAFLFLAATTTHAGDTILAQAKVPNALMAQAEVFLIERGSEILVLTRIDTLFPNKVRNKIAKTERKNWGKNSDMEAYLVALNAAFAEYEKQKREKPLLIEFIAITNGYRADFRFSPDTVWRSVPLSASYLQKNQEYILRKAFGKKADGLIQKLRTLNPLEKENAYL